MNFEFVLHIYICIVDRIYCKLSRSFPRCDFSRGGLHHLGASFQHLSIEAGLNGTKMQKNKTAEFAYFWHLQSQIWQTLTLSKQNMEETIQQLFLYLVDCCCIKNHLRILQHSLCFRMYQTFNPLGDPDSMALGIQEILQFLDAQGFWVHQPEDHLQDSMPCKSYRWTLFGLVDDWVREKNKTKTATFSFWRLHKYRWYTISLMWFYHINISLYIPISCRRFMYKFMYLSIIITINYKL